MIHRKCRSCNKRLSEKTVDVLYTETLHDHEKKSKQIDTRSYPLQMENHKLRHEYKLLKQKYDALLQSNMELKAKLIKYMSQY